MTTETTTVRVLLVDDVAASRETLRRALAFDQQIEVVGEAGSGPEAVEKTEQLRPDLVLMDVRMPDGDGVDATRRIVTRFPQIRVVALTAHDDVDTVRDMLTAGATGYALKGASVDELLSAVHKAWRGEAHIDERVLPSAVHELRRLLREERERRTEVERLARIRQEFVQVLSHELRTPLTVMSGALRYLIRRGLTDEEEPLIASALQRGIELERMIEGLELIGESRHDDHASASPCDAIDAALVRVEGKPDSIECAQGLWRGVRDRHLARIAFELIDNALRHGKPPVEVRAWAADGLAHLVVSDGGNADLRPELFEAFAAGDMSATRSRGGLGLGLFVAQRLCEADLGKLSIRRDGGRTIAEVVYEIPA